MSETRLPETGAEANYKAWIAAYVERTPIMLGQCTEAVTEMHAVFPELRIVKGHVEVPGWGRRGHWWLETAAGKVVDPTASQFPHIFEYDEYQEGQAIRVGTCMNCGDPLYVYSMADARDRTGACSPKCERELREYYA